MRMKRGEHIRVGHYKKRGKKRLQGQWIDSPQKLKFPAFIKGLVVLCVVVATLFSFVFLGLGAKNNITYSRHINLKPRAAEKSFIEDKKEYKSMAVIEKSSKRLLSGYNEMAKLPMASTTKIMTAILTIEHFEDLNQEFEVPEPAVGIEGTSMYLKKGEKLTIEEYLYGLMLPSANDSAVALACLVAGSEENFSRLMNEKAKALGLTSTNFVTASGLHDENHYTTSYDLAKLTAYAMENEKFREIVKTEKITVRGESADKPRHLKNKQKLMNDEELISLGVEVDGVKSGFTPEAGRCLVTSAKKDDMEVIVVVLNAPDMFLSSASILKEIFEEYSMQEIVSPKKHLTTVGVMGGKEKMVNLYTGEGFRYPLTKEELSAVKTTYDYPSTLVAPFKKDQPVGELKVQLFGETLFSTPILTIEEVEEESIKNQFQKIVENFI